MKTRIQKKVWKAGVEERDVVDYTWISEEVWRLYQRRTKFPDVEIIQYDDPNLACWAEALECIVAYLDAGIYGWTRDGWVDKRQQDVVSCGMFGCVDFISSQRRRRLERDVGASCMVFVFRSISDSLRRGRDGKALPCGREVGDASWRYL
jgi:hypothetical protein